MRMSVAKTYVKRVFLQLDRVLTKCSCRDTVLTG
jgi:hypothetical protein